MRTKSLNSSKHLRSVAKPLELPPHCQIANVEPGRHARWKWWWQQCTQYLEQHDAAANDLLLSLFPTAAAAAL